MTDPLNPSHDEPAEGPRDDAYSAASGAETEGDSASERASANDAAANASARAGDMFEQIKVRVEDAAEKAAPTVRELSAKAAELVAVAADRAAPIAKQAGEATAGASSKLAVRSREWAAEIREQVASNGGGAATATATEPRTATDIARDVAEDDPPLESLTSTTAGDMRSPAGRPYTSPRCPSEPSSRWAIRGCA
jgi:hypothetical protein